MSDAHCNFAVVVAYLNWHLIKKRFLQIFYTSRSKRINILTASENKGFVGSFSCFSGRIYKVENNEHFKDILRFYLFQKKDHV